jgi:hypothetical protein
MMKWVHIAFLFLLGAISGCSVHIVSINPSTFYKYYNQDVEYTNGTTVTTLPINGSIALITDRIYPHDRLPFPFSARRCHSREGLVEKIWEMQEGYSMSCCTQMSPTIHVCPRLPSGEMNFMHAMAMVEDRDVYVALVKEISEWEKSSVQVHYEYQNKIEGVIRGMLGTSVMVLLLFCGLHLLVGGVHKWSNTHPAICIGTHWMFALVSSSILMVLIQDTETPLFRAGLMHTLLQILFSVPLVYIPSDGTITVDQRVEIASHSWLSALASSPMTKWFSVHVLAITTVMNVVSVYAIFHILWDRFDAAFDVLTLVSIGYLLMLIVFYIAFLTAIYDIHSPLRVDTDTVVLGTKGVVPDTLQGVLLYDYRSEQFLRQQPFEQHTLLAAYTDATHFYCWKIGTYHHGKIALTEHSLSFQSYCPKKSYVKLPQAKRKQILLFTVDKQLSLMRIGTLQWKEARKDYHVHLFHTYTLRFFELMLKLAPVYDDSDGSYQINVVENLRSYFQKQCNRLRVFHRYPQLVSWTYVGYFSSIFIICTYWLVWCFQMDTSWGWFYALDAVFLFALIIFGAHVATKKTVKLTTKPRAAATKRSGSVALQLHAGDRTDYYHHEELTVGVLSKSLSKSICFVKLISPDEETILQLLWPDRCPNHHGLLLYQTDNRHWSCDACSCPLQHGTTVWYCATCNWAKCEVCAPNIHVQQNVDNISLSIGNTTVQHPTEKKWAVEISL